jgi:hypothetical protein
MKSLRTSAVVAAALAASVLPVVSSSASAASAAEPELLSYRNKDGVVSLTTTQGKLPGAPRAFKKFVRSELRSTWQGYFEGRPACKGVPTIDVDRLRTDGFAMGTVTDRGKKGCAAGGGYVAIWAVHDGEWREAVGTQDVPTCARLERFDIPAEIGIDSCYDGSDVVPYTHA